MFSREKSDVVLINIWYDLILPMELVFSTYTISNIYVIWREFLYVIPIIGQHFK